MKLFSMSPVGWTFVTLLQCVTVKSLVPFSLPTQRIGNQWINKNAQRESGRVAREASSVNAGGWGVEDDWVSLSVDSVELSDEFESFINKDAASIVARQMEDAAAKDMDASQNSDGDDATTKKDQEFVTGTVDFIHHHGATYESKPSDPALYDTEASFQSYTKTVHFLDEMGKEIGLLVRCNQSPEDLLIEEGRALKPLTDEERDDPSQLVSIVDNTLQTTSERSYLPTLFFFEAIASMFKKHATMITTSSPDGETKKINVMDAASVARWMSMSLGGGRDNAVSKNEKSVMVIISKYSTYGTGFLTQDEFLNVYMDAVAASGIGKRRQPTKPLYSKHLKVEQPSIKSVWRDLRNHGIQSPVEQARVEEEEEIRNKYGSHDKKRAKSTKGPDTLMDECEILDWGGDSQYMVESMHSTESVDVNDESHSTPKSSHELLVMSSDGATPKNVRDGQFVFIDEESCIGCTQCAQIAPSSFLMLDDGRARTFGQSNSPEVAIAVSACPVSCMHNVAFHELKEMEQARDKGDGRDDHRHMGRSRGHTPLHVSGIDSDANHKSSWYHYLKQQCHMTKSCPQRGCYDCPHYSSPGENPNFKKRQIEADSVRANDIVDSGEGDLYRNVAEL